MQLMGRLVGANGQVVGVDRDGPLGATALEHLRRQQSEIYRFVESDLMAIEQIQGAPFDLVFTRLLLFHLPDPLAALKRMWNWVKPGGTLLVMDLDMTSSRGFPSHPVGSRAIQLMRDIFVALGKDIEIGSRMPYLFASAGIGTPDACDVFGFIVPNQDGGGMVQAVLKSLRPAAIAKGVIDVVSLDALDEELSQIKADGGFGRWPDLVATRKRKPH
jgi:SAM-dependent methyltransferase